MKKNQTNFVAFKQAGKEKEAKLQSYKGKINACVLTTLQQMQQAEAEAAAAEARAKKAEAEAKKAKAEAKKAAEAEAKKAKAEAEAKANFFGADFENALFAWFCDVETNYTHKNKGEKNADYTKRLQAAAKKTYCRLTANMKRNTTLFSLMTNTNKLFEFVCNFEMCYYVYDVETLHKKQVFAKVAKVAINAENLTDDEKEKYELLCEEAEAADGAVIPAKYEKADFFVNDKKITAYCANGQSEAIQKATTKTREQRTRRFAETKESFVVWLDVNDNLVTLTENKVLKADMLYNFAAYALNKDVQEKIAKKQEAKKQAEAARKAAKQAAKVATLKAAADKTSEAKQAEAEAAAAAKQAEAAADKAKQEAINVKCFSSFIFADEEASEAKQFAEAEAEARAEAEKVAK